MAKSPKKKFNYPKAVVIVHGKTEYMMIEYIRSHLHLNVIPYGKNSGSNSIQITSLMKTLNSNPFDTRNHFEQFFSIDLTAVDDFKVYVIMDTDDCTERQKDNYISKAMFSNHWLNNYLVPIYNSPNMDVIIKKADITAEVIHSNKVKQYSKIFPTNRKSELTADAVEEILEFKKSISKVGKVYTNLPEMLEYCLSHTEKVK